MNINARQRVAIAAILIAAAAHYSHAEAKDAEQLPVERYALYIASNNGGAGRETLRYAETDARTLSRTMAEIGGIKPENSIILASPTTRDINDAFADFVSLVRKGAGKSRRTEFLFYYSGHSDEKSFILGNERYSYADLKNAIDRIPSDVHVVMLDSCYSGNFVRTKGGSRKKPFLMDDSTIVQGHAYLSSSSGFESSQESDRIQASYFTHALVTGLRGAADTSGDSKVSLNELYHYAFNETLSQTELSSSGPQHPSYDITLVGSGDLVLTDISAAESVLHIGAEYEGKYFIRDTNGTLVSELNKIRGTEIALALPAGSYIITVVSGTSTMQGTVTISKGERLSLAGDTLLPIAKNYGRARGDATETMIEESAATKERYSPFSFAFVPGINIPGKSNNAHIALGTVWSLHDNIKGVQLNLLGGTITEGFEGAQVSGLVSINSGYMKGVQVAGIFNSASGDAEITGVQVAGIMNTSSVHITGSQVAGYVNVAKDGFYGAQCSSLLNIATGESKGVQVSGIINVADEISGIQVGLINVAKKNSGLSIGFLNFIVDGIMSPAIYVNSNGTLYVQYQGGTNRFFTTFLAGTDMGDHPNFIELGFGIGTRFVILPKLSCDVEILTKTVFSLDDDNEDASLEVGSFRMSCDDSDATNIPSLRTTVQYSFYKHLSVFAAVEAEFMMNGDNESAFNDYGRHTMSIEVSEDEMTMYPTFSLGLKF